MSISNSMVCHKWAHGNTGKSGNMNTDGKRLISYNTDVAFNTGRGLVFISNDNMSPSTGKQLSCARSASSHLDVVYSPVFHYGGRLYDFDEKRAFSLACEALNVVIEGYSKAKLGKYLHGSMIRTLESIGRLVALAEKYGFGQWVISPLPDDKLEAARVYAEQWGVKDLARREANRIKEHARQAAHRELQAGHFELWRNGGAGACPSSYRLDANGGYYIAVRGDKVVTSGGAECPTEHARLAVKFWRSRDLFAGMDSVPRDMGGNLPPQFEVWHRNGHRVQLGTFQLDRIESNGTAFAGCHKFSAEELTHLAGILL